MRILEGWTEVEQEEVLDLLRILALQWRIDEDFYSYCAQKKTKEDLQGVIPSFPRSYLGRVVEDLASKIIHVPRNFPREYLNMLGTNLDEDAALEDVPLPASKPSSSGFAQMVALKRKSATKTKEEDESTDPLRVRGWHNYCHEKFQPLCKKLREKDVPIFLNQGLKKAGMKLEELPELEVTDDADPPPEGSLLEILARQLQWRRTM